MIEPFVSVFVVNRDGRAALEGGLPSLQTQDYPQDRFEVFPVDNLGAALESALAHARGDYLAFLDNHIRVEPSWMRQLVEATAQHDAAGATSKILNAEGTRIEFAGGIVSLVGHTWSLDQGSEPTPLLFGHPDAMVVERGAYHAAGGFDFDDFDCGEDLDLGWRMSLLGYKTVLVPTSVGYRQSATGLPSTAPRLRLKERNALYTIYKYYGEDLLHRVLPVAIALTLGRALHESSLDPADFAPGTEPAQADVSSRTLATLMAVGDFARHLDQLKKKRDAIQSRRVVADETLLPLFLEPLKLHELGPAYESLAAELYDEFGLSRVGTGPLTPPAPFSSHGESLVPQSPLRGEASRPTVSIIVLTALGPTHLPECLSSLRELNYPKDKLEVILVDNASREDPTSVVRRDYPDAKVVRLSENRGFCGGIAAGAKESQADWLAFLNDDTRVDPEWISEMLATADRRQASCVATRILDWTGERIDFAGGAVNFEGKGFQLGHGSTKLDRWAEERPVLFACGAAMLVRRDLFLETGGFDEAMFAYYEDVAFGWQLSIRGYDVWLSPKALVYHKHQGTAGRWAAALRARLYERNALRIVFTHLQWQNLLRVLPASLLLMNQRVLSATGLIDPLPGASRLHPRTLWQNARSALADRGVRRGGVLRNLPSVLRSTLASVARRQKVALKNHSLDDQPPAIPATGAAVLAALDDWLKALPEMRRRRAELQRGRRRSDAATLSPFSSRWTSPASANPQAVYNTVHESIVREFSLDRIVKRV